MPRVPAAVGVVLLTVLAGCTAPGAEDPAPDGNATSDDAPAWAAPALRDYPPSTPTECPSRDAQPVDFDWEVTTRHAERAGMENQLLVSHPAGARDRPVVTWLWRQVDPGSQPDSVTRAGPFRLYEDASGGFHVCGRVTLVAPTNETPPAEEPRTLHVTARPRDAMPAGNYTVTVNWEVGCPPCGGVPRGSASGGFQVFPAQP